MSVKKHLLESITFLRSSQQLQKLVSFGFFNHFNWGALIVILPFWFEQNQSFSNFTYHHSAVIFVSGTSFLWTNLIDRLEMKQLSLLLSLTYLVKGILLLFPTNILSSIISGVCGGVCMVFYILIARTWINNWDDEKERSYVIAWSSSEFRIAMAVSAVLVSFGFFILGTKTFGLSTMILLSSMVPMINYLFLKQYQLKTDKKPVVPVMSKIYQCFKLHKNLMIWSLLCSSVMGLHAGLILPYASIVLNRIDFNPVVALNLISAGNFAKIFCQPIFASLYRPSKKERQILIVGISYAVLLGVWSINLPNLYLTPIVILTFVMQTALTFVESNILYSVFPKEWSLQLFTFGSFVCNLSNVMGVFLGNLLISHWQIQYLIFIGAFLISLSGFLYYLFIKSLSLSEHNLRLIEN